MSTTPAEILLAQAQSQLARQESKLTAFRTTAGTVLGTGGLVAGLLATRLSSSISAGGKVFASLAVVAFLAGTLFSLRVIAPADDYKFSEKLASYVTWLDNSGAAPGADVASLSGWPPISTPTGQTTRRCSTGPPIPCRSPASCSASRYSCG